MNNIMFLAIGFTTGWLTIQLKCVYTMKQYESLCEKHNDLKFNEWKLGFLNSLENDFCANLDKIINERDESVKYIREKYLK